MTPKDFNHAASLVWDWIFAGEAERLDADPLELPIVVQRIVASQYEDQRPLNTLPRHVWLARRTIEIAGTKGFPLSTRFFDTFGLTFEELLRISLGASAWASASSSIPAACVAFGKDAIGDMGRLPQFWEMCALDYDEFAEHAGAPGVSFPGLDGYGLSPTINWPVLRRTDGEYVVPVMHDLVYRAARSFRFDAMQAAGKANHDLLQNVRGLAFESFVGEVLRGTSGAGSVQHTDDVLHDTALGKRCDWVCVDGSGGRATLVEAKAGHLPLKAAVLPTPEHRREYVAREGGIASAVAQLEDTAQAIREGRSYLRPKAKLIGLVVIDGPQIMLNDEQTREAVAAALDKPLPSISYQVATSDGLVQLALAASTGDSMWERLQTKHRNRPDRYAEMHSIKLPPGVSSITAHPALKAMAEELREIAWSGLAQPTD